jgi:hypothetical protein
MDCLHAIQDKTIKCCKCGKEQKLSDMKFRGIQFGTDSMDYDLALYNCECRGTNSIKINKKTAQKRGGIGQ